MNDKDVEKIIKANMMVQMNLAGIREDFKKKLQRQWVGLTDEERKFIELGIEVFGMSVEDVLKEAEAKLKEKNT